MNISLNELELKFLLFGSNSIFHNEGLCIYGMTSELKTHPLTFLKNDFESIKLTKIEDRIKEANLNLISSFNYLKTDAVQTAKKIMLSVARQGVLISSDLLKAQMNPHVHRQVYSTEILPCLTVHYNLTMYERCIFRIYEKINAEDALTYNLCGRKEIVEWCNEKKFQDISLIEPKNIILFDSGRIPHSVIHSSDINIFFIFDNVKLINTNLYNTYFSILN